jgi:hypothetical protein
MASACISCRRGQLVCLAAGQGRSRPQRGPARCLPGGPERQKAVSLLRYARLDLSWVKLVHTWPPEEQSKASRKASSSTLESLTCTGAQDAAVLMVHTHRGIGPSVAENLVRKSTRCQR